MQQRRWEKYLRLCVHEKWIAQERGERWLSSRTQKLRRYSFFVGVQSEAVTFQRTKVASFNISLSFEQLNFLSEANLKDHYYYYLNVLDQLTRWLPCKLSSIASRLINFSICRFYYCLKATSVQSSAFWSRWTGWQSRPANNRSVKNRRNFT